MKLHLEPNLDFQLPAVEAVRGLSRGQDVCRTEFTLTQDLSKPVFHDSAFDDDAAKTNFAAILEQRGCENVRSW